ncbi:MAG: flagellar motor switch protein FliN [Phycisphaeraceae bacterium]|nr:flagellar motor switch protein FliN [Phycisphaeraceae bacterium]
MAEQTNKKKPAADDTVEKALDEARQSLDEVREAVEPTGEVDGAELMEQGAGPADIGLLGDVDLHVSIELGRTEMLVEDVLKLAGGSVVELDKLAGDPVDVFANGRLVARGEVLVLNDNFCIRISEIVDDLQEQVEAVAQEQEVASTT